MKCSLEDCLPAAGRRWRRRRGRHAHEVAIVQKARTAHGHGGPGIQARQHLHPVGHAAAGLDLAHLHALVAAHHKHVREPVAHHQRLLRHGEGIAAAQREVAARKHPRKHGPHACHCVCCAAPRGGARRLGAARRRLGRHWRQVHVDQRIARLRVHRGRDHAHGALGHGAAGGGDADLGAGLNAPQLGGRDLGAPLQAALAHHAEQLRAGPHYRAHGGGAGRDHATVRCHHLRVFEAQLLRVQRGLGGLHAGLGGLLGRGELLDLLLAECARGLQRAGAVGIGGSFGRIGLGFEQAGAALGHIGQHRVGREGGQHLPGLDHIAHVHTHVGQAQAVALGPNARLLPGRDVAVGSQAQRNLHALRLRRADGERRPGLARLGFIGGTRCTRENQRTARGQHAGGDHGEGGGGKLEGEGGVLHVHLS